MKNLLRALMGTLLVACAAHNSHRVEIDLTRDLDPLLDEAFAMMKEQCPPDTPLNLATSVEVEPVVVRWRSFETGPDGTAAFGAILEQADLAPRIAGRLEELAGAGAGEPEFLVTAQLRTDLHQPDTLYYQISCRLVRPEEPGEVLARGESTIVYLPRLFCHGCREAWGGHGTRVASGVLVGAGYVGYMSPIPCYGGGGGGGYIKVH